LLVLIPQARRPLTQRMFVDWIHPSPQGHAAIANAVYSILVDGGKSGKQAMWREKGIQALSAPMNRPGQPKPARAHNGPVDSLSGRRQVTETLKYARLAVQGFYAFKAQSDEAVGYNYLGFALAACGEIDDAMAHYQKALEINPNYALAHTNLGIALADRGQLEDAIIHFQKAVEINPGYALAHNNLGFALADRGRIDEALIHYRKALEIDPKLALARSNLGDALASRGQIDEAIVQFQRILGINPNDAEAHRKLRALLAQRASHDSGGKDSAPAPEPPRSTEPRSGQP
jgi:tetratricopeptide (TPR) repeat protein